MWCSRCLPLDPLQGLNFKLSIVFILGILCPSYQKTKLKVCNIDQLNLLSCSAHPSHQFHQFHKTRIYIFFHPMSLFIHWERKKQCFNSWKLRNFVKIVCELQDLYWLLDVFISKPNYLSQTVCIFYQKKPHQTNIYFSSNSWPEIQILNRIKPINVSVWRVRVETTFSFYNNMGPCFLTTVVCILVRIQPFKRFWRNHP